MDEIWLVHFVDARFGHKTIISNSKVRWRFPILDDAESMDATVQFCVILPHAV